MAMETALRIFGVRSLWRMLPDRPVRISRDRAHRKALKETRGNKSRAGTSAGQLQDLLTKIRDYGIETP